MGKKSSYKQHHLQLNEQTTAKQADVSETSKCQWNE